MIRANLVTGAGASALMLMLAGCGDGSTAGPSPTPTPVNTSLAKLVASQSFANNAATGTASFDLTSGNATSASSASKPLTFSYDLASNSYTVSTDGRSQTFKPADQSSASGGIAIYQQTNGGTTDRLTLESASVTGFPATGPQYSGIGYWQRYSVSGNTEATTIDFFTYGLNTAASAVPRTGQATYAINLYGLVSVPGSESRFVQGTDRMDVDFADGTFVANGGTTEKGLATGKDYTDYNALPYMVAAGTLSSNANAFSGTILYHGMNSISNGTLNGQFYGPKATELGGEFTTSGSDGSSASGVIWGIQDTATAKPNLSLTSIVEDQTFGGAGAGMTEVGSSPGSTDLVPGTVKLTTTGAISINAGGFANAPTVSAADKIASSDANFDSYQSGSGVGSVRLDSYKVGSANTELALTYSSFIRYTGTISTGSSIAYQTYGLYTDTPLLMTRTGSATYNGVAYGTAYDGTTSASVTGKASFTVNFDLGGYSGSFGLKNATTDYGTFNTTGTMSAINGPNVGSITGTSGAGNGAVGQFAPSFFGPTGQEFGGPFTIGTPSGTTIVGAALSKGG